MTCSMPRKLYRNYLRMRGEYALPACHATSQSELPPHARRILQHVMDIETSQGTTSACAENTRAGQGGDDLERNYLRMRGEYRGLARRVAGITELPPHARRILHSLWGDQDIVGTTSACAENTADHQWAGIESWNYLRMRGEYCGSPVGRYRILELPPHARRIPPVADVVKEAVGTTSACAENTRARAHTSWLQGNYLRMRGEYALSAAGFAALVELPPHARRIPPFYRMLA